MGSFLAAQTIVIGLLGGSPALSVPPRVSTDEALVTNQRRNHHLGRFVQAYIQDELANSERHLSDVIQRAVFNEARRYGFDPLFLLAVIEHESQFSTTTRGAHGEIGLMQIKPSTAEWVARKLGWEWRGPLSLEDPIENIRLGAAYLNRLRRQFGWDERLILSAYNRGETSILRALEGGRWAPSAYTEQVLDIYYGILRDFGGEAVPAPITVPGRPVPKSSLPTKSTAL